jgi:hypothetical protein
MSCSCGDKTGGAGGGGGVVAVVVGSTSIFSGMVSARGGGFGRATRVNKEPTRRERERDSDGVLHPRSSIPLLS